MKDAVILDFETEAIASRPVYPPKPVGMAIEFPGERKGRYYSWGHPTNNNCTWGDAHLALERAWESGLPIVCHHSKFDVDVAEIHMRMRPLPWERIHDTEYLLFLSDPHARSLALKPSATRILGMPPEERDAVRDWLVEHRFITKRQTDWGAYICKAPGDIVGKYAVGDTTRTKRLFQKLLAEIQVRNMNRAYDRERHLMPILLRAERVGIRADLERMRRDWIMYSKALEFADNWLRKKLHAPNLNLDADQELGEVLDREGVVTEWTWTKGGRGRAPQRSVSKKNLTIDNFKNRQIALVYAYRVRLSTCLSMFLSTWIEMAEASGGFIYTNWNQVRQADGKGFRGTRTGRLSSNPNLQNIPKDFEDKDDHYEHPAFLKELPPLPLMRMYLLPDENCLWLHRDYNQQELRMLAHFEDGPLCQRYNAEPRFDIHTAMQTGLREMAIELTRTGTKILNFSDVYGKGLTGLAESLHVDREMATRIKEAKRQLMPGVDALTLKVKQRGIQGLPIRTWGGREYYAEKPAFSKKFGRVMDFYYKLLNYLIQGSSADVTKEATIRYDEDPRRESRFLLTVHDEENASSPSIKGLSKKAVKDLVTREMRILGQCMESVAHEGPSGPDDRVMVPMLTDGKTGVNWGTLTKFDGDDRDKDHIIGDAGGWYTTIQGNDPKRSNI